MRKGDPNSMVNLCVMIEKGDGIPSNKKLACNLYRAAAQRGHLKGLFYYALCLDNREGTDVDKVEANRCYKFGF